MAIYPWIRRQLAKEMDKKENRIEGWFIDKYLKMFRYSNTLWTASHM
jgi:hypothetical protein